MKQNRFTKLLAAGAACTFALSTAVAQESTTTTTTAAGSTAVSTSAMDGTGTITTFSPDGNIMTVRTTSSAEPITYYYTPQTVVVDPTGAAVQLSALRPDMPVTYTYTKEGDRMIVTKVTLQRPITYYEKTTTTTTTNP
jgi:hypothetical protein